jgi:hypothetical protein
LCEEGIRGRKFRAAVVAKINEKKERLMAEAKERFGSLCAAVKDAEKQLSEELSRKVRSLEGEIGRATREGQSGEKLLGEWLKEVEVFLRSMENASTLKSKIEVFYGANKPQLNHGEQLLSEVNAQN